MSPKRNADNLQPGDEYPVATKRQLQRLRNALADIVRSAPEGEKWPAIEGSLGAVLQEVGALGEGRIITIRIFDTPSRLHIEIQDAVVPSGPEPPSPRGGSGVPVNPLLNFHAGAGE